jgi:chromate reductase, NAD(P)H dehydrogenase (quinone)
VGHDLWKNGSSLVIIFRKKNAKRSKMGVYMSSIITIAGFTGSVRAESSNKAVLRLAQELLPASVQLDLLAIEDLTIEEINVRLQRADAILIATPEYKGLLSRALRIVLTQIAPENVAEKPVALLGVGRSDGQGHQHTQHVQLRHLLGELNAAVLDEQVYVSAEQLNDGSTDSQIRALLESLVQSVQTGSSVLAN